MAIITRLAFGTPVTLGDVPYEGIESTVTSDDIALREVSSACR